MFAVLAASACGSEEPSDVVEPPAAATELEITSPAFADGEPIPVEHTCEGEDRPPELAWSTPPDGTASHAVIVDDPDAPGGTFTHWLVADLPADARSLGSEVPAEATVGENDAGTTDWRGPCPPPGDDAHRYRFIVTALDTELELEPGFTTSELADAMSGHIVAEGTLIGTFERGS